MDIDYIVANAIYNFNKSTNNFFTPFLKFITVSGNLGLIFIIVSLILLIFKKTRVVGIQILISLLLGTIIVNIIKPIVRRDRPFINESSDYYIFYTYAGSLKQSGFSLPSGHTCAAASFGFILFLKYPKKYSYVYLLIPLIFGFTRIYFNVHYFTDVLLGFVIGVVVAIISYYLFNYFYNKYKIGKSSKEI